MTIEEYIYMRLYVYIWSNNIYGLTTYVVLKYKKSLTALFLPFYKY